MADLKDLAEQYGLEDYEQLLGGYPNAEKFLTGLKDAAVRSVPTTEQMRDPNFIIDAAGLGGAIKAYHGTPHLFDRFDMSKIGTGEGAQAYGHGLYFAENPLVAESYRKNLSAKDIAINDKKSDLITDMLDKSVLDYITTYGNKNAALDVLNEKINYGSEFDDIDWLKNVKNKLELSKIEQPSGNLYETSIRWPNAEREATDPLGEHHLLDWDQPLSEQSDYVRNKLKKSDFYKNANKAYKDQKQWYLDPSQKTGESFLKYMRSGYDDEFASGIKDAEQYLKNLDIPGLKYLDATSRSTDKGTRNYVMFGDEYPEITKRAGSLDELKEKYAEGGIVKAQDQNENLGKLAEMLGSARDVGNQYTVPSWVPLAGGVGAGDLLMGKTPEEIENWSYGNAPMQIPEMSNVPQFKRGRAQSLADALTTLAPGVKATEGLPAGLSFIGPKSKNWDKVAAELAAKKLDEGADPAEVWREHLIGRMPDKTLFSEISDKDALYHEHGKDFYDSTINKKSQLLKHGRDTASYPLNVQDMLAHPSFYENYPNLEATELKYLPETSNAIGGLSFADNGDPVLNIHGMLPNDEAKSTMLHELQHAIQRDEGWGQGGSPAEFELSDVDKSYWQNIYDKSNDQQSELLQSLLEKKKAGEIDNNDIRLQMESLANRNGRSIAETMLRRDKNPIESYKRLAGEAQARATQDRMDMDMVQRRENYPLAGGKLSDIPLEDLIYKYEGNGPSLSVKKSIKNLNQALLDKYIERGYLPEDELVKYEKNAAKMRNTGRQDINIQNAQANPEYEAYKAEYDVPFMHGTERLDRVLSKEGLDSKRATSGPMLYGTDSPEIASSYAKNKQDTSMIDDDDWDYSKAFTVSPQQLGHRGTIPYTVEQSWNYLDPEVKRDILTKAPRVGYSDLDQWQGDFVLHPEGEGNAINQSHYDYLLKQSRNNPIKAMRDYWLDSGNLFNEEEKMSQLYRLAGYPHEISQEMAPWTKREGVLTGVSRITKPLDTSNVDDLRENVIPALKQAFKNDKSRKKDYGADSWDKNTRYTPKEWVNELESDLNKGENSYVWTSIPDKITSELKRLGYNGIYDTGGKSAGADSHQVTIPFNPSQIRSKFAAFDPILKNSPNLLAGTALGSVLLRDDDQGYAEGGSVDKDSLQLDKPQRTPNHPTKSHIVKTMVDGKENIIRFGEQGAETAGKPKEGESDRMTAKRESFKARHAKNIAKGKSSAAYWADKVKWAEGGSVNSDILEERLYNRAMAHFDDLMANKYADGGSVSEFEDPAHERLYRKAMAHFDDLVNA